MEDAKELQNKVESVLFAAGRKISLEEISRICKDDPKAVKTAISSLIQRQKDNEEPLLVVEESDGFKMIVREMYSSYVKQIIPATELGKSILETLAVIAWKQPANQSEIVKIRSSKAYDHIAELEDLGFIHKERKGRSFILKTTQKFADYFDLPSSDEIKKMMKPAVEAMQLKDEQEDALKEKVAGMEVYYEPASKKKDLAGMEVFEESEQQKQEKKEEPENAEEGDEEGYAEEERAEEETAEQEQFIPKPAAKAKKPAKEEEEGSAEETEEPELEDEDKEEIDSMMKSAREEFESEKAAKKAELKQKAIDSLNEEEKDEIKIEEKGRKVDERLEGMLEINKKTFNKLKGTEVEEEYKPEEEEEEEEPAKKSNKKNHNNI